MLEISGLWLPKNDDSKVVMSGSFGRNGKLLILKNNKKRPGSKDPDYRLMLVENEPKQGEQTKQPEAIEDDLPF